jgi:hypothetical protein
METFRACDFIGATDSDRPSSPARSEIEGLTANSSLGLNRAIAIDPIDLDTAVDHFHTPLGLHAGWSKRSMESTTFSAGSHPPPLDLIQAHVVAAPIIRLCRTGGGVVRHGGGRFRTRHGS